MCQLADGCRRCGQSVPPGMTFQGWLTASDSPIIWPLEPRKVQLLSILDLNDLGKGPTCDHPLMGDCNGGGRSGMFVLRRPRPGGLLSTVGTPAQSYTLTWGPTPNPGQANRSWADTQEATEYGATALAVLLARAETGHTVVQRSRKGTGIDYWMGEENDGPPFQHKARLEISGILHALGDQGAVRRAVAARVSQKVQQVQRSGTLPAAHVVVVEFGTPLAEMQTV